MSDVSEVQQELPLLLEITRTRLSDAAVGSLVSELSRYHPAKVVHAIRRCKFECKRPVTLADLIERMPGGSESHKAVPTPNVGERLMAHALGNRSLCKHQAAHPWRYFGAPIKGVVIPECRRCGVPAARVLATELRPLAGSA